MLDMLSKPWCAQAYLPKRALLSRDPGKSGRTGTVNSSLMIVQADIVTKTAPICKNPQLREGEREDYSPDLSGSSRFPCRMKFRRCLPRAPGSAERVCTT
jgi:hypothetical protein